MVGEPHALTPICLCCASTGNLHLNVTAPEPNEDLLGLIEPFIYEFTAKHRGSISAEHGMGLLKPKHMVSCL